MNITALDSSSALVICDLQNALVSAPTAPYPGTGGPHPPVYPHSLLWHRDNLHPALTALREHLAATTAGHDSPGTWTPSWA